MVPRRGAELARIVNALSFGGPDSETYSGSRSFVSAGLAKPSIRDLASEREPVQSKIDGPLWVLVVRVISGQGERTRRDSASKQFNELFNREPSVSDDAAERAGTNLPVIGNNHSRVRVVATKHHVAASLASEDEPGALQRNANFTAGQICRKLGQVPAVKICFPTQPRLR